MGQSCWPPVCSLTQNDWVSLASQVVVGLIDGVPILIDEGGYLETLKRGAKTLYSTVGTGDHGDKQSEQECRGMRMTRLGRDSSVGPIALPRWQDNGYRVMRRISDSPDSFVAHRDVPLNRIDTEVL